MIKRIRSMDAAMTGVLVLGSLLLAYVVAFQKQAILNVFDSGTTVRANFAAKPNLVNNVSEVKIADVTVGEVRGISGQADGSFQVKMLVDDDAADKLGSEPHAQIRATTALGGKYFVDLQPSGDAGELGDQTIPVARTKGTTQLGDVLTAFQGDARQGIQSATKQLDTAFNGRSQDSLQRLLDSLPAASRPTETLFTALTGTRPEEDLGELVSGAQALASELTAREDRVANIVDDLGTTSAALGSRSSQVRTTLADLPETLTSTRVGLDATRTALEKVQQTARSARPSIQEAEPLVVELDKALDDVRPLTKDLQPLLADAEPMLEDAVPLAKDVDKTVVNFKDPVITRLKGPVTSALVDAWHGTGPFAGNGNDNPLYKEVGYLAARGNLQSIYGSKNGTHLALELGLGFSTPGGNDLGFSALVQQAFGIIPIPDGLAQSIGYPSTDTDPVTVSSRKSPVIETPAAAPLTDGLLDLFKGLGSVTQGGSQ